MTNVKAFLFLVFEQADASVNEKDAQKQLTKVRIEHVDQVGDSVHDDFLVSEGKLTILLVKVNNEVEQCSKHHKKQYQEKCNLQLVNSPKL